jgi:hypothetical protein
MVEGWRLEEQRRGERPLLGLECCLGVGVPLEGFLAQETRQWRSNCPKILDEPTVVPRQSHELPDRASRARCWPIPAA